MNQQEQIRKLTHNLGLVSGAIPFLSCTRDKKDLEKSLAALSEMVDKCADQAIALTSDPEPQTAALTPEQLRGMLQSHLVLNAKLGSIRLEWSDGTLIDEDCIE